MILSIVLLGGTVVVLAGLGHALPAVQVLSGGIVGLVLQERARRHPKPERTLAFWDRIRPPNAN
jgi:hypothetical protein